MPIGGRRALSCQPSSSGSGPVRRTVPPNTATAIDREQRQELHPGRVAHVAVDRTPRVLAEHRTGQDQPERRGADRQCVPKVLARRSRYRTPSAAPATITPATPEITAAATITAAPTAAVAGLPRPGGRTGGATAPARGRNASATSRGSSAEAADQPGPVRRIRGEAQRDGAVGTRGQHPALLPAVDGHGGQRRAVGAACDPPGVDALGHDEDTGARPTAPPRRRGGRWSTGPVTDGFGAAPNPVGAQAGRPTGPRRR